MDFATCKEKLREQIKENDRLCLLLRTKNNEYSLLENKITKLHKEIERLREALTWIDRHPVEDSKQWGVAVKEMKRLACSALQQKEDE
jgi:predicted nuclease with TOPRIM domain